MPDISANGESQWMRRLLILLTFIAAGFIFYRAAGILGWQNDVTWHTLNGLEILRTHTIPLTDTWTWKTPGHPWNDAEWLWDLGSAWVYLHFGWFGVRILVTGIMELLVWVLWRYARAYQRLAVLITLTLVTAMTWITATQARPQILSYLFFAMAVLAVEKARTQHTQRPLWLFLPNLILWNNIHGSAVLWVGLVGLEMLFAKKRYRQYIGIVLVSLAALMVRPDAFAMVHFVGQQLTPSNLSISEWLSPNFHQPNRLFILGYGIALIGYAWGRVTFKDKTWLIFGWVAFFVAQRFFPYAIILTWVVFVRTFKLPDTASWTGFAKLAVICALSVQLISGASRLNVPFSAPLEQGAAEYCVSHGITEVVNEYSMGGTLALYGIKTIADGRALWSGEPWFTQYASVNLMRDPLPPFLEREAPNIRAVVWEEGGLGAYQMDHLPGWKKVYDDKKVGVWQKQSQS